MSNLGIIWRKTELQNVLKNRGEMQERNCLCPVRQPGAAGPKPAPRGLSLMRRGAGVWGRHVASSRIKACAAGLKGHGPRGLYSEGEFRVLRLGNRVLMSGIIMATLISVERSPRHLFMDLNPVKPVLTR